MTTTDFPFPPASATIMAARSPIAAAARPLAPPRLAPDDALLARRLGRGLSFPVPDAPLALSLRPGPAGIADAAGLDAPLRLGTAAGPVDVAHGARLVQGLTGIPPAALAAPDGGRREWIEAALRARLAGTPFAGASIEPAPADALSGPRLRLELGSRRHLLALDACAPAATWLALLDGAGWVRERAAAAALAQARTAATVAVARHTLPRQLLAGLAPGDTIVPDRPRFRIDGSGWLALGGRRLRVRYVAPLSFEVLDLETLVDMEDAYDNDEPAAGDPAAHAAQDVFAEADAGTPAVAAPTSDPGDPGDAALDDLPVELLFELGRVALPLGEARALGPGAVLMLEAGSPGAVAITSGAATLGRGEIVDVDGRLGIRLTRWSAAC